MSMACPVVCSDAGGNYELVNQRFIFSKGKSKELTKRLVTMLSSGTMNLAAKENFERAKDFEKNKLNKKRWAFIKDFMASK